MENNKAVLALHHEEADESNQETKTQLVIHECKMLYITTELFSYFVKSVQKHIYKFSQ